MNKTETLQKKYSRLSELELKYDEEILKKHPEFHHRNHRNKIFSVGHDDNIKRLEFKIMSIMIRHQMYYEFINFVGKYKSKFWFLYMYNLIFLPYNFLFMGLVIAALVFYTMEKQKQLDFEAEYSQSNCTFADVKVFLIRESTISKKSLKTSLIISKTQKSSKLWVQGSLRECF